MGWLELHKDKGQSYRDFFQESTTGKILDSYTKNGVFYAALQHKEGVSALVILIQSTPRKYYNFAYKWMDESFHPYYYECPDRILDLLTPTENKCSNDWREECRRRNKRNKQVSPGTLIRFDHTIRWKGYTDTLFIYKGNNVFKSVGTSSGSVRIPKWKSYEFTVIRDNTNPVG